MRSRINDNHYIIFDEDVSHLPDEVDKQMVDDALTTISNGLSLMQNAIKQLYDFDYNGYAMIAGKIFGVACLDVDEGRCWNLDMALEAAESLKNTLSVNDSSVPLPKDALLLEDVGFRLDVVERPRGSLWEKTIEDNDERTVQECVFLNPDGTPRYIRRTTLWQKQPWGKSSTNIQTQQLPISEEMLAICKRTALAYRLSER